MSPATSPCAKFQFDRKSGSGLVCQKKERHCIFITTWIINIKPIKYIRANIQITSKYHHKIVYAFMVWSTIKRLVKYVYFLRLDNNTKLLVHVNVYREEVWEPLCRSCALACSMYTKFITYYTHTSQPTSNKIRSSYLSTHTKNRRRRQTKI